MVMNVSNAMSAYRQAGSVSDIAGLAAKDTKTGAFSDTLKEFMSDAVNSIKGGEEMAAQGAAGKADLQEVILAVSNAEIMMQTVTSIRDKVISAYQEVIRTSI